MFKIAILLFSVHSLPNQCLLQLYPAQMTDLPMYLPETPNSDGSYQKSSEWYALCCFPGN